MSPDEHKQLQKLKREWPKHWPKLEDLQQQSLEIMVLTLAGRFHQLETDVLKIARVMARHDPEIGEALDRYYKTRDKKMKDTVVGNEKPKR